MRIHIWHKGQVSKDTEQPVSINQQITFQLSQSLSSRGEQKAISWMPKIQQQAQLIAWVKELSLSPTRYALLLNKSETSKRKSKTLLTVLCEKPWTLTHYVEELSVTSNKCFIIPHGKIQVKMQRQRIQFYLKMSTL